MASLKDYLLLLNDNDATRFRHYLESPFFAIESRETVLKVFNYIWKKTAPNFEDEALDNANLSQQLGFVVNNHKTRLVKLLEEYFKLTNILVEHQDAKHFLVYELAKRGDYKNVHKKLTEAIREEEVKNAYKVEHYGRLMELYNCYNRLTSHEEFVPDAVGTTKSSHYLGVYYLTRQLPIIYQQLGRNGVVKDNLDIGHIKKMVQYVKESPYCDNILVMLYTSAIDNYLNNSMDWEFFNGFKATIMENFDTFGLHEQKWFDILLVNTGHVLLSKHGLDFISDFVSWYEFIHHKGILTNHYAIKPNWLLNVVPLSLKIHKYKFVEEIIDTYGNLLDDDVRDSTINLLRAFLYCEKGLYPMALQSLESVKFVDIDYTCMVKYLSIRCHYKLENIAEFDNELNNLDKQMQRNNRVAEALECASGCLLPPRANCMMRSIIKKPLMTWQHFSNKIHKWHTEHGY